MNRHVTGIHVRETWCIKVSHLKLHPKRVETAGASRRASSVASWVMGYKRVILEALSKT